MEPVPCLVRATGCELNHTLANTQLFTRGERNVKCRIILCDAAPSFCFERRATLDFKQDFGDNLAGSSSHCFLPDRRGTCPPCERLIGT